MLFIVAVLSIACGDDDSPVDASTALDTSNIDVFDTGPACPPGFEPTPDGRACVLSPEFDGGAPEDAPEFDARDSEFDSGRVVTPPCVQRRASLLAHPDLIGWGARAAQASRNRTIVVTNLNSSGPGSFNDAIETDNAWVLVDPALDGGVINVSTNTTPGIATVYDGRDARLTLQQTTANITIMSLNNSDNIIFNLGYRGMGQDVSGGGLRMNRGERYWAGNVEGWNFGDDCFSIGRSNDTDSARYATWSCVYVHDTDKGLLLAGDNAISQETGRAQFVTIHNSWLAAQDRNIRNSGFRRVHAFNNLSDGWSFGVMDASHSASNRNGNSDGTLEASMFVQAGAYINPPASGNTTAERGTVQTVTNANGSTFVVPNYIYYDSANPSLYGAGVTPGSGNWIDIQAAGADLSFFDLPPYAYTLKDSAAVEADVKAHAGLQSFNIDFCPEDAE